jgi:hypothetical protein
MRYGVDTYRMYDVCTKKLGVCWGLVDKISPACVELRNPGVPAVVVLACRVPAGLVTLGLFTLCGQSLRRVPPPALAGDGPTAVFCHPLCALCRSRSARSFLRVLRCICFRTTGIPLCCSSWAVSSPYLLKTALAALASLCPFDHLSQSLFCLLLQPILT